LGINQAIAIVSRIRAEAADGYLLDDAIRIGIKHAGEGAIGATCVILAGVFPWSFSPALFHHQMAVLLTILLAANVLASLWVLPAVISSLAPRFISSAMGAAPGAGATVASTAA
jgi:predicted RND superfamily exporter protein